MQIRYFDDCGNEITEAQYKDLLKHPSGFYGIEGKIGQPWLLIDKEVALNAFDLEETNKLVE